MPALIGEQDEPEQLVAQHPIVRELQRRHAGLRLPRTGRVLHALVPSVFEQKITGTEAFRAYAAFLRVHGEPAPGPAGLLLPPDPETLASLPYHAYHPIGIERRRAEVVRRAAARADLAGVTPARAEEATRRLHVAAGHRSVDRGRGRAHHAFGDPDAVSVGDYHLPERGRLGARRRAASRRRPHARAARAVPRSAWPRAAAAGGRPRDRSAPRTTDGAAPHRRHLMRIALATVGTTGDVRPFATLARALVERGHAVTAVTLAGAS